MGNLFDEIVFEGDKIRANVPNKGWRQVVSINGVSSDRILALAKESFHDKWETELNSLLPAVMDMTDSPLTSNVTVVGMTADEKQETYTLPFMQIDKEAAVDAVKRNFEGIIAVANVAGISTKEMSVIFAATLMEFKKVAAATGTDMQGMMGNMLGGMLGAMGAHVPPGMPQGAQPENCQTQ